MPLDQLIALSTLAVVGCFTPGPNNAIATVTSANHGFRAVLPHVFGVPFGFSTMLVASALGVAALLLAHPWLSVLLKWAGIVYLLWIALQLARASPISSRPVGRPLNFWQSAAFQYTNPKAWMLAAATAGSFMATGSSAGRTALIVLVFSLAAVASLVLWAALGAALRQWLTYGVRLRAFNLSMGAALAGTALWLGVQ